MGTTALLIIALLPLTGAAIVLAAIARQMVLARRTHTADEIRRARGFVMVFATLPATLILFAFALAFLYFFSRSPVADSFAESGAIAFGVPALMVGLGYAIIFDAAVPAAIRTSQTFGKSVVAAVILEVALLNGFALSFLILGASRVPAIPEVVQYASKAALVMAAGSLLAPVAAAVFRITWDWKTIESWRRAIILEAAFLGGFVASFSLSFLALRGGI